MARAYGSHGDVSYDSLKTPGTPIHIGSLDKWSLNMSRAKADVTSFGDSNMTYVVGLPDIKGALSGFWDSADVDLFAIALGNVPVKLTLTPNTLEPTFLFEGLAYLDATIEVSAKGAITVTGTFVAAGLWDMKPTATPSEFDLKAAA